MKKLTIKNLNRELSSFKNTDVTIEGWVRTLRSSKAFGFIEVNDGSFLKHVQVVFDTNLTNFEEVSKITIGSSIKVIGKLVETENAKQPFEIQAASVEVQNLCDNDYPIQKKNHTFEYLWTVAHLRPRTNTFSAVFRVRSAHS